MTVTKAKAKASHHVYSDLVRFQAFDSEGKLLLPDSYPAFVLPFEEAKHFLGLLGIVFSSCSSSSSSVIGNGREPLQEFFDGLKSARKTVEEMFPERSDALDFLRSTFYSFEGLLLWTLSKNGTHVGWRREIIWDAPNSS